MLSFFEEEVEEKWIIIFETYILFQALFSNKILNYHKMSSLMKKHNYLQVYLIFEYNFDLAMR
jgi:hypothetical protein